MPTAQSIKRGILEKPHHSASRITPENRQHITKERLKALLPKNTNVAVTDEIVHLINNMGEDVNLPQELLEEDLMSYINIMSSTRGAGFKELINAIKYCNLKRNMSNRDAWSIVFPDRYKKLEESGSAIDNHVSMYTQSKLVVSIDKEMLIPVHLQYAPYFHAAVKKQYEIMNGISSNSVDGKKQNVSPMVQHLAAKELANLTRQPEESKLSITVNPGEEALSAQAAMTEQLKAIVANQRKRLEDGEDIIDVQQLGISFDQLGIPND